MDESSPLMARDPVAPPRRGGLRASVTDGGRAPRSYPAAGRSTVRKSGGAYAGTASTARPVMPSRPSQRASIHAVHTRQPLPSHSSRNDGFDRHGSSRLFLQDNAAPRPSSSSLPPSHSSSKDIDVRWADIVSVPHCLSCVASPHCHPCCVCCCISCVRTTEVGILERFGKFAGVLQPGAHGLLWPMERVAGRLNLRVMQLDVRCETKTRDNVFVQVQTIIQYQILRHHEYEAHYSLHSPPDQIKSHVYNVVRSALPLMDLDDIFASKDSIALEIHRSINGIMNKYGYEVVHALITDIRPDELVAFSMNEMETSRRYKMAMPHKAEAIKIKTVKEAEGRAERAYLIGRGVANERKAIAKGIRDGVADATVASDAWKSSPKSIMDLVLLTQYFDVLTLLNGSAGQRQPSSADIAGGVARNSIILHHEPRTVIDLQKTTRRCFSGFGERDADLLKIDRSLADAAPAVRSTASAESHTETIDLLS